MIRINPKLAHHFEALRNVVNQATGTPGEPEKTSRGKLAGLIATTLLGAYAGAKALRGANEQGPKTGFLATLRAVVGLVGGAALGAMAGIGSISTVAAWKDEARPDQSPLGKKVADFYRAGVDAFHAEGGQEEGSNLGDRAREIYEQGLEQVSEAVEKGKEFVRQHMGGTEASTDADPAHATSEETSSQESASVSRGRPSQVFEVNESLAAAPAPVQQPGETALLNLASLGLWHEVKDQLTTLQQDPSYQPSADVQSQIEALATHELKLDVPEGMSRLHAELRQSLGINTPERRGQIDRELLGAQDHFFAVLGALPEAEQLDRLKTDSRLKELLGTIMGETRMLKPGPVAPGLIPRMKFNLELAAIQIGVGSAHS